MTGTRAERAAMRRRHVERGLVLHFLRLKCLNCSYWILIERYGTKRGGKKGDGLGCPKCGCNVWRLLRGRNLTPVEAVTAALSD